ncbi:MAG: TIGR03936 family radical SAM-associated protein [Anaerolineae bacterium]|nr:TIGR03936 family radical SAM-associated protein [Anaerolineae bacterium]MCO5198793.1 TIGR03936 family radical SAM-associated protein [Anaerolineae bacterium]MCO5205539.1 TIGR03936 family radical SAM-associated protein [Anaerolineae bacterium]
MSTADYVQRLRITFRKEGPTRYISHLDLARTWERALNRAQMPMAYTHGFNRRPRMQFAAALPLGVTSSAELVDILLVERMGLEQAQVQIMQRMAPGITVTHIAEIGLREPSLPASIVSATYRATLTHAQVDFESVQARVAAIMAADAFMVQKFVRKRGKSKAKTYDLRELIEALDTSLSAENIPIITMRLKQLPSATGRPDELLRALEIDPYDAWIHRTALELRES